MKQIFRGSLIVGLIILHNTSWVKGVNNYSVLPTSEPTPYYSAEYPSRLLKLYEKQIVKRSMSNHPLTTSVVIPCYYAHAEYLPRLLKLYENQSETPDEVIIALSEYKKVNNKIFDTLKTSQWKFPVKIIVSEKKQYAGINRNIGCSNACGDILITQDADDIPHPQRVEIIKYFFKNYNIDHFMHKFVFLDGLESRDFYTRYKDIPAISFVKLRKYDEIWGVGYVSNGSLAISRNLFKKVQWTDRPSAQDVEFNEKVYSMPVNHMILEAPLLIYRIGLGSLNHRENDSVSGYEQLYDLEIIKFN